MGLWLVGARGSVAATAATAATGCATDQEGFAFGDTVSYEVQVSCDQPVDYVRVEVSCILGHHPQATTSGCTGSFITTMLLAV
ncbi:hypothetical protein ACT3UQ_15070 [Glutamicibacter sp. AOP12-B1-11]|uniref:hypothetical protein n=1 Tax=Glutamicibacter sp. AOP12-B1-11 TaxID=3457725 RepID=UPI0040336A05